MINIFNETKNATFNEDKIKKLAHFAMSKLNSMNGNDIEILNLIFVDSKRIKNLNKKFRGINEPTDVLSFSDPYNSTQEIYICLDIIAKNAKTFGEELETELERMIIHGILHIYGYDHDGRFNPDDVCEEFFIKQEEILKNYNENAKD